MKQFRVLVDASQYTERFTVSLEDLSYTEEEWNELSEDDKYKLIQQHIDDLPPQPFWIVESYEEK